MTGLSPVFPHRGTCPSPDGSGSTRARLTFLAPWRPLVMPAASKGHLMADLSADPHADLHTLLRTAAEPDPWLTPDEAADLIGRAPATLKTWRSNGSGPAFFRTGPSGVRYRLSAVVAWSLSR